MKTLLKCLLAVITVTIVLYLVGCFIFDDADTSNWPEKGRVYIAIIFVMFTAVLCAAICDNSKKHSYDTTKPPRQEKRNSFYK